MRTSLLTSITILLVGAGLSMAQQPAPAEPADAEPTQPAVSDAPSEPATGDLPPTLPATSSPAEPSGGFGHFNFKEPSPAGRKIDDEDRSPFHVWAGGEYLLWWFKDAPVSTALVTTGPDGSGGLLNA